MFTSNHTTTLAGTATDHNTIMEKVKAFYQKLYKRRVLNNNYGEFLDNLPKVSDASKAAMEADLTLEELQDTMKSKGMKDTAPGPDGIPYSVYDLQPELGTELPSRSKPTLLGSRVI